MNSFQYQGRPCVNGHSGVRWSANRTCIECSIGHARKLYRKPENEIPREDRYFLKTYGISRSKVEEMLKSQNGKCRVCYIELVLGGRTKNSACVDHDHTTGKVRGILCNHCNRGLGMFFDNQLLLYKAIEYLKEHE